jgi:hypothetical protein
MTGTLSGDRSHNEGRPDGAPVEVRRFVWQAGLFVLVGAILYLGVYAGAEQLIRQFAQRNRFYMVKTAPHESYDYVILGASHATVFDFQDMNARLEQMTGSRILNLSTVGGGITVNRLLLEYFLSHHQATAVVYFLDSFVFYSREWNEDRLQDARLFHRAPFDPALARLLLQQSLRTGLEYIVGFSKINNPDRFEPDVRDEEAGRFLRTYRPVEQIDRQRLTYLYPTPPGDEASQFERYLGEFEDLVRDVTEQGMRFIAIKPPIPERVYRTLPGEEEFDATVKDALDRLGAEYHDLSLVSNDEEFFYDTDHLNRDGVLRFYENYLSGILTQRD